jgi:hypothetical protein
MRTYLGERIMSLRSANVVIVLSLGILTGPALARIGKYTEIPRAKPVVGDEKDITPGFEVPEYPDRYVWKTTLKYNGNDLGFTNIRVFLFTSSGRSGAVGEIPAGTEVEIKEVKAAGGNLYYSVPFVHNPKGINPDQQYAWVQGAHLYAASKRSGGK